MTRLSPAGGGFSFYRGVGGSVRLQNAVAAPELHNTAMTLECKICIKTAYMQWEIFSYVCSETLCSQKIIF